MHNQAYTNKIQDTPYKLGNKIKAKKGVSRTTIEESNQEQLHKPEASLHQVAQRAFNGRNRAANRSYRTGMKFKPKALTQIITAGSAKANRLTLRSCSRPSGPPFPTSDCTWGNLAGAVLTCRVAFEERLGLGGRDLGVRRAHGGGLLAAGGGLVELSAAEPAAVLPDGAVVALQQAAVGATHCRTHTVTLSHWHRHDPTQLQGVRRRADDTAAARGTGRQSERTLGSAKLPARRGTDS